MRIRRLEISLMIVLIAQSAGAVDGVAEISETCAAQTGCFGEDLPGYPVTIDGFGITAELGSTVSNNTAADNSSAGFALAPGSTISAYRNEDSGISAFSGSAVQGNTVYENGTFGRSLGTTTPYLENVISNDSGTIVGG